MIWISNFPLPPSVNDYLIPVATRSKARLVKSQVHRKYSQMCLEWRLQNLKAAQHITHQLLQLKTRAEANKTPFALIVDCYVAFQVDRVFTVNQKCHTIDANNRLKPLLDGLAKVIRIDDKHFFAGNCEKITTPSRSSECALIRIELMRPRSLEQIKALMIKENLGGNSF